MKLLYRLDRRIERSCFVGEPFAEEEQPCGGEIGLGFDLFVAILGQCVGIVPEHHLFMPRNEAVADLMCLVPAVFLLRQPPVEQYPLPVRKVERLKRCLPYRIEE